MIRTRKVVFMGLFVAMNIVFVRLLSFMPLPTIRVDFGFIPLALSAIMFGPFWGGITGAISDVTGFLISPQGAYFPGFTISAFISGFIYGLVLHKKPNSIIRTIIAFSLNSLVVDMVLNTVWLDMLYHKGIWVILPARLIKIAIMFPMQVSIIYSIRRYLKTLIMPTSLAK